MSSDFYFRKWQKTVSHLEEIVNLDVEYQVDVEFLRWREGKHHEEFGFEDINSYWTLIMWKY